MILLFVISICTASTDRIAFEKALIAADKQWHITRNLKIKVPKIVNKLYLVIEVINKKHIQHKWEF